MQQASGTISGRIFKLKNPINKQKKLSGYLEKKQKPRNFECSLHSTKGGKKII